MADKPLRASEAHYRALVEQAPDLLLQVESDGSLSYASPRLESMLGLRPAQVLGTKLLELIHEGDRGLVEQHLKAQVACFRFRHLAPDRSFRWLEANSARFSNDDGSQHCVLVCRDATERKATERALGESAAMFDNTFRASPNPNALIDLASSSILRVNRGFETFFGYSRAEAVGATTLALGIWPSAAARQEFVDTLQAHGALRAYETTLQLRSKELRTCLMSAEMLDIDGRRCVIVVIEDVTEQRRVEAAKALLEEQLLQVQKLDAIGSLAGGIAHDFNNILGAMLGYAQMAKLEAAELPDALESLTEVLRAGQRAKELVRQILTFSRQHPPERRPIRLQPVVDEAQRLLRSTLPSTLQFSLQVSPDTERVHADPTQMQQVLLNLATNAAHAMQGRMGALTIRLGNHEVLPEQAGSGRIPNLRAGKYVALAVSDAGCGMARATLERIFEPFFTTKTRGDGTGLGLSVVHGIVTAHDGIIHVESEPEVGTTFHVLLPAFLAAVAEEAEVEEREMPGCGERVLFIDDEPTLCSAAEKLLSRLNYVVTTKTSALEALKLFRADPTAFDLVITDLTMPGMTGVDVAAQVLLARPGMPLILATGFNANWTLDALRKLGIHDLVMKPLSLATLSTRMRSALA